MEGNFIGQQPVWSEHLRSGIWSLKDQFNRRKKNLWSPSQDPFADNVLIHLKMDSLPINDDRYINNEIINSGNISINTSIKKYGTSSLAPNSATISSSIASLAVGLSDFCIEFWSYAAAFQNTNYINLGNNAIIIRSQSNAWVPSITGTVSSQYVFIVNNTWEHISLSRQNTLFRLFVNGIFITSISKTVNITTPSLTITTPSSFYMDSFRLTVGTPRYTANFNPETDTYLAY